jgi:phenylpropionate dioxygenase-like ring-hydroxylating dioxygenase large terminal subunit
MTASRAPRECWYVAASADEVRRNLIARRVVDRPVVLYRLTDGTLAALEDRCAHRPYPLSLGRLEGDLVHCGLCGFAYDSDGRCVSVPTQKRVPIGAAVPALPVREESGLVWVWLGEPGRAALHRIPDLGWLTNDMWTTVSGHLDVAANFLLLHESFADVTQIPVIAPDVSPEVLHGTPPPLDVVVTETTVSLRRRFSPGHLPEWQARALGISEDERFEHVQEGHFLSPAAWVDHWDVLQGAGGAPVCLRFSQLVTPVDATSSRLLWRVSRDFAIDDVATTDHLTAMFTSYYARVVAALETAQRLIDRDGPGPEVNVSADVAALKVRAIVKGMAAEERGSRSLRRLRVG